MSKKRKMSSDLDKEEDEFSYTNNNNNNNNNYIGENKENESQTKHFEELSFIKLKELLRVFPSLYETTENFTTFEKFKAFLHSNYHMSIIISWITSSMNNEDPFRWSEGWAKKLAKRDDGAMLLNDCRRFWTRGFLYPLTNLFMNGKVPINRLQEIKSELITALRYCLAMDRANAIFNMGIPWYSLELKTFPVDYTPPPFHGGPSMNRRLVYLLRHLELADNPEFSRYFNFYKENSGEQLYYQSIRDDDNDGGDKKEQIYWIIGESI